MNKIESEVKFLITDKNIIRKKILNLGAENQGEVFEYNILFDDKNDSLFHKKNMLRLRRDKRNRLTLKIPPENKNVEVKTFKELEVDVDNFDTMTEILNSLGLFPKIIYEKYRETLLLNDSIFCIDSMPFGNFLEIEANEQEIRPLSSKIGLCWPKRSILNYFEIFEIIKDKCMLSFSDITFKNFAPVNFNPKTIAYLFESGN